MLQRTKSFRISRYLNNYTGIRFCHSVILTAAVSASSSSSSNFNRHKLRRLSHSLRKPHRPHRVRNHRFKTRTSMGTACHHSRNSICSRACISMVKRQADLTRNILSQLTSCNQLPTAALWIFMVCNLFRRFNTTDSTYSRTQTSHGT